MKIRLTFLLFSAVNALSGSVANIEADAEVAAWHNRRNADLTFSFYDRDGDRWVDSEEWRARCRRPDQFKFLDENGDCRVSLQEFCSSVKLRTYDHPAVVYKNVTYKQIGDWRGLMDIYMPVEKRWLRVPVVVFIHGGGWQFGQKEDVIPVGWKQNFELKYFTAAGFAVAAIDYRLCKFDLEHTVMFDCVVDCKDAVRFLAKEGNRFGLAEERIIVFGGSAGGHLAQLVVLSPPDAFPGDEMLRGISVQPIGGISRYGPSDFTDFTLFDADSMGKFLERFRNRLFLEGESSERIKYNQRLLSPISYLKKGSPPMLFMHGNRDRLIPYKQMLRMQSAALEIGADMRFVTVGNAGHGWKHERGDGPIDPGPNVLARMPVEFAVTLIK